MATSLGIGLRHTFGFQHTPRTHTEHPSVLYMCAKETSPSDHNQGQGEKNAQQRTKIKVLCPHNVPAEGCRPLEPSIAHQKVFLLCSPHPPIQMETSLLEGPLSSTKPFRKGKIARVVNTHDCQASSGHLLSRVSEPLPRGVAPRMHWAHSRSGLWMGETGSRRLLEPPWAPKPYK